MIQIQRQYQSLLLTRFVFTVLLATVLSIDDAASQCLSAANPVGGSSNLLVLDKSSLRLITFYRYNYGNQFYEGRERSDFDLIRSANYNFIGTLIGYGLLNKLTLEADLGYFVNKTYTYNLDPPYVLSGSGLSSSVLSAKYGIIKDNENRFFISSSLGAKIPFSTKPVIRNGVELPVELQPTIGAYGFVFRLFMVKEKPLTGSRYFATCRVDINSENKQEYKLGTSVFSSLYYSKHLMFPWLKGDWTVILQVRNEIRQKDRKTTGWIESTGSNIFYFSPQLNLFIKEKLNVSLMVDVPVYKYLNGTQLATKYGISLNLSRDFQL
jgi:hypothetical protein